MPLHQLDCDFRRIGGLHGVHGALLPPEQVGHGPHPVGRVEEAVVLHPLVRIELGDVARAAVGQDDHDVLARADLLRQVDGDVHRRARGPASEQAFLAREPSRHHEALLVVDAADVVEDGEVHRLAEHVLADAFHLVDVRRDQLSRLEVVEVDGPLRIDADVPHPAELLLQVLAGPRHRAAGAQSCDEEVEVEPRRPAVLLDLRPGDAVVRFDVVGVVVLVQHERARRLAVDALGRLVVAARILGGDVGGRHHHFGAERLQSVDLLGAHLVGHGEHAPVALHRGPQRHPHARIAGGVLDDGAARPQPALAFGLVEDEHGHAVLDGPAGIHELALGVDGRVVRAGDLVQPHQRDVPDRLQDVLEDGHRRLLRTRGYRSGACRRCVLLCTGT